MRIDAIKLKLENRLANDYYASNPTIINHFDYSPYQIDVFNQRLNDLKERTFNRTELSDTLKSLNEEWGAPESTFENIERLKIENSVVVIGGQQAGLLTGPLFTIHKIISIIQLAKQQEKLLGVPVIPVFWIAGEDHDFEEINHVFHPNGQRMKKHKIRQHLTEKLPMSALDIDKEEASIWLAELFGELPETKYTSNLYQSIFNLLQASNTYVDFFARLIFNFFESEGLVLIDSGNSKVRGMESDFFCQLINKQPKISERVFNTLQELRSAGYSLSVDVDENEGHLFYHKNGERILLVKEGELWVGKQGECSFNTEELLAIAKESPELLSNNVVTRPLMQEYLFPSLAFIGGLGEVGYWSILKPAFHELGMKMPPVFPRLSFTLIEPFVDKRLKRFGLEIERAVKQGVELNKGNWLANQTNPPISLVAEQVKQAFDQAHLPLRHLASQLSPALRDLSEKNLEYIYEDLAFLEKRLLKEVERKNKEAIQAFNYIQWSLRPQQGLQERSWNVIPFLNKYGKSFIKDMLSYPLDLQEEHFLVYL
ncbi:bacillithiol biosynthesis cysteine-adding enzyme BshC [Aquibacillus salsiterrae]|uniref:Putative cysteine ligase BshC n=1 Tax=Aquibacillus salsiterrae TaxID=2950439 RepID=A0A9X3WFI4_9BACI|nr:bacillithiol biosynthesis cysteine-adding enzyme BshC [Aquibacillus salsiterrae]MDC3416489.1 bacillithiol biosynthesis cysteine-adding enzyme BshC [Aquibacillus salsiterrae]